MRKSRFVLKYRTAHVSQQWPVGKHEQNEKYSKIPKISDTQKFAVITLQVEQGGITLT